MANYFTIFPTQFCTTLSTDSDEDEEDDVLALVTVVNLTLHKVTVQVY